MRMFHADGLAGSKGMIIKVLITTSFRCCSEMLYRNLVHSHTPHAAQRRLAVSGVLRLCYDFNHVETKHEVITIVPVSYLSFRLVCILPEVDWKQA